MRPYQTLYLFVQRLRGAAFCPKMRLREIRDNKPEVPEQLGLSISTR